MPRGLTVAQRVALEQTLFGFAYFVRLDVPGATPVRCWTGYGTHTALGGDWLGLGDLGVISGLQSETSGAAQSISINLSGLPRDAIPGSVIGATRATRYQGSPLEVYLAITDTQTGVPVGDPVSVWLGQADTLVFDFGTEISVSLSGEHLSTHLRRSNGLRMTTESHNARIGSPAVRDIFFDPQTSLMGKPRSPVR